MFNERKIIEEKKPRKSDKSTKNRRKRLLIAGICAVVLIAVVIGYIFYEQNLRTYSSLEVKSTVAITNATENSTYHKFKDAYICCSESGVSCFEDDKILWTEQLSLAQPIIDICEGYAAVCDTGQREVYLFNESGLLTKITSDYDILDVEVSSLGTVAISANNEDSNYIYIKDSENNLLINMKSVFSSSGYLADIALSKDGTKLVAAFMYAEGTTVESKAVFYNLENESEKMMVGGFNQYNGCVLTDVEFMGNGNVVCIGDNAISVYSFADVPSLINEELNKDWDVSAVFLNNEYIGFITSDPGGENNYRAVIYNASGTVASEFGFDYSASYAAFADDNILLYTNSGCQLLAFGGREKFSYSFASPVGGILPLSERNLLLGETGTAEFVRIK